MTFEQNFKRYVRLVSNKQKRLNPIQKTQRSYSIALHHIDVIVVENFTEDKLTVWCPSCVVIFCEPFMGQLCLFALFSTKVTFTETEDFYLFC